MNLYINSPAYYTQKFGVIDEIHQMCSGLSRCMDITKYTRVFAKKPVDTIVV